MLDCWRNFKHNTDIATQHRNTMQAMTELEELQDLYCEMHKDVYGVKARWYRAESVEQARKDLARLEEELKVQIEQDKKFQQEAMTAFMQVVNEHCGGDFEAAKRWQHQAYDTGGDDDYLAYRLGLPYGYFRKQEAEQKA